MKLLVVRNDRLGDFMLAWPSFGAVKLSLPDAEVWALVPEYTREMAELCPWIDRVLTDGDGGEGRPSVPALSRVFRRERFDAMIALYSTTRVGLAGMFAGVRLRLAPATKVAQFTYTHRLRQRRSRSEKPEWRYNLDLAECFLRLQGIETSIRPSPPYLRFPDEARAETDAAFRRAHGIEASTKLVFVHPGSGGSARNLSVERFAALANGLASNAGHAIVVTAGPGELPQAEALYERIQNPGRILFHSTEGLKRFAEHLNLADVFISGSTGPLHIAGALDRPTAAFYPLRRSATALRWETLNTAERRMAFSPSANGDGEDMSRIDVQGAAREISERFLKG